MPRKPTSEQDARFARAFYAGFSLAQQDHWLWRMTVAGMSHAEIAAVLRILPSLVQEQAARGLLAGPLIVSPLIVSPRTIQRRSGVRRISRGRRATDRGDP